MQILPLHLSDTEFEQLKLNPSKSDRKYIRYRNFYENMRKPLSKRSQRLNKSIKLNYLMNIVNF